MSTTSQRIAFTSNVEQAIANSTLADLLHDATQARNTLILKLRAEMDPTERQQLNNLQTLLKEQMDVAADLLASPDPPALWQSELRLYNTGGIITAHCAGFEVMCGDNFPTSAMLVTTRLTRECRRVYFRAMASGKFLVLHGPAGTGKTETAKDITRILGREPVVLSCSSEMTMADAEEALALVARSGPRTPVIFDEFNRLSPAMITKLPETIRAAGGWACFTFNPGYSQGTPIPADVQAEFDSLAMTLPDFDPIAAVMLGCEGFVSADDLGSQINSLLRAAADDCSKQRHYDFGLRSLKALVKAAGSRAHTVQYANEAAVVAEVAAETLHAMCIAADKPVVRALVEQHFQLPLEASAVGYGEMLWQVLRSRHCGAMLGALEEAEAAVRTTADAMNVQVVSMAGTLAALSAEQLCADLGPLATAIVHAAAQTNQEAWILVQAAAVGSAASAKFEALNMLMDDNKVLITQLGSRVELPCNVRIVFLLDNAQHLAPATVSRLGVVFVEGSSAAACPLPSKPTIMVKTDFKGDKRRMSIGSLGALTNAALELYGLSSVALKYQDDEGDYVTLQTDADFAEAVQLLEGHHLGDQVFKVSVGTCTK